MAPTSLGSSTHPTSFAVFASQASRSSCRVLLDGVFAYTPEGVFYSYFGDEGYLMAIGRQGEEWYHDWEKDTSSPERIQDNYTLFINKL